MATHARIIYLLNALLLSIIWLMAATDARAETFVYTGAWSDHIASEYDYNESHRLFAVQHEGVIGGYFRNSFDDDSFFLGISPERTWGNLEGSLLIGGTYGYKGCKGEQSQPRKTVCPMIAPAVSYTEYKAQPTVIILGNAVSLSVRWEI